MELANIFGKKLCFWWEKVNFAGEFINIIRYGKKRIILRHSNHTD